MRVKELMTAPVKTCRTSALLGEAAEAMLAVGCGCLPVVDSRGRLTGMVTDRDICLAVARHTEPWSIAVRDVMSPKPIACRIDDYIDTALVAMKEHRVRRIPVIDDLRHLKGLISIDDVIRNTGIAEGRLPAEAVVDVLRHICAPVDEDIVVAAAK